MKFIRTLTIVVATTLCVTKAFAGEVKKFSFQNEGAVPAAWNAEKTMLSSVTLSDCFFTISKSTRKGFLYQFQVSAGGHEYIAAFNSFETKGGDSECEITFHAPAKLYELAH